MPLVSGRENRPNHKHRGSPPRDKTLCSGFARALAKRPLPQDFPDNLTHPFLTALGLDER